MKLDIGGVISLFIAVFVLFTIADALYSTVNDSVNQLNTTMFNAGYTTSGAIVVYGWRIVQYVLGLGALIVGAKWLTDKAKGL